MNNSTETFTDKLKRQQEEQAQELLRHTRQTLQPLKTDITRLYGDVGNSIEKNTANIRRLLTKNLMFRWWIYPLIATTLLLPFLWAGGSLIVKFVEKELSTTLTALENNNEALKTMTPWGVWAGVIDGTRYLAVPGKRKPELIQGRDGEFWFVKIGPAANTQGKK